MPDLPNPHDHYFRATFARRDVAVEFLRHYVPTEIAEQLDLSAVETVKDTFVDEELRDHFTDLLYHVRLRGGSTAYVYLLFEHKSYREPWTAFQLLRYMVRIWEHWLEQERLATLPPIVPLVVYHGQQRWRVDQRFGALVATPEAFAGYVPDFRYELCDLSAYSDAELVGAVDIRVAFWLMKHIFDEDWHTVLFRVMPLLEELSRAENGLTYVESALRYMVAAARTLKREDLAEAVELAFPKTGGALMQTIAQTWVEEGRKEGLEEGRQQGLKQGLKQGLEQGLEQGIAQGMRQGLLDSIELGLELRFGVEGLRLWPEIAKLEDIHVLNAIREGIRTADTLAELRRIYQPNPHQRGG
jgi:predicted transposase/invertase (TIGR01784 family)